MEDLNEKGRVWVWVDAEEGRSWEELEVRKSQIRIYCMKKSQGAKMSDLNIQSRLMLCCNSLSKKKKKSPEICNNETTGKYRINNVSNCRIRL